MVLKKRMVKKEGRELGDKLGNWEVDGATLGAEDTVGFEVGVDEGVDVGIIDKDG